ncbi:MAG TPA: glucose-1-phosphate adenylyltransferase [Clostridiales bacterium]|nr:glucose-1-phosphate adenylyltransferase [Clostridiales bacterium]
MGHKTECIAMLLAGGQGSRLGVLTHKIAKPAVPFGGKYRIIDFPLSNCVNSGIDTVGVLTQYQPLELNDYIGNGEPWDLDRVNGGVHILSPYQQIRGTEWYKGTANAIYQNIHFIDKYDPEYVAVLSGDHIYKMDYADMLAFHKEQGAACTIAMREVEWKEASRFGLMLVNPDHTISEFEEKPEKPRSNKASMGIYIFTWSKLREYLVADEANPASSNDFGKDVIPAMHGAGEKMVTYQFDAYWRDVGTIDSLWEANMDLLSPSADINLDDPNWKIYARNSGAAPQFLSAASTVTNSLVTEGCRVDGKVDWSVLFANTNVAKDAAVTYSIVMPGAVIGKGAEVKYAIIGENAVIADGAKIGADPEEVPVGSWGVTVIGPGLTVGENAVVPAAKMVETDIKEGTTYEGK